MKSGDRPRGAPNGRAQKGPAHKGPGGPTRARPMRALMGRALMPLDDYWSAVVRKPLESLIPGKLDKSLTDRIFMQDEVILTKG